MRMRRTGRRISVILGVASGLITIGWAGSAQATEGGASLYLLGSGGPGAAVMPPLPGVYLDNEIYVYDGSASGGKQFVVGGNVVAGLDATIVADFPTMLWVPTTNFAGGTLAIGGAVPFGSPIIDVNAVLTGPLGGQRSISRHDSATVVGDPIATAALGWKTGKVHIQASTIINFPIGNYREDKLANLAFHRWAVDGSLALSWNDPEAGWDVTGKAGVTFNGKNDHTDYDSGNEFHLEGAVEKTFTKSFSAGVQGYYFKQLSGDSGAGARLGSFKGEVFGIGATAAAHGMLGRSPATVRFRFMQEFDATNRLKGASVWMGLSLPLHMVMPAAPPPAQ